MSHFTVLVIGDNIEEQLQPYHEYECTGIEDEYVVFVETDKTPEELQKDYEEKKEKYDYESFEDYMWDYHGYQQNDEGKWGRLTNPNAKWDWYQVGGRWTGYFRLKEGANGTQGSPGIMTKPAPSGTADSALKKDIDFESMRQEAIIRASKRWDIVSKYLEGTEEAVSWQDTIKKFTNENDEFDRDGARSFYNGQERVAALNRAAEENRDELGFFLDLEEFDCDKDTYLERAKNNAICTYALVKDSEWQQKGQMGWFGISSDEMDENEWARQFNELLDELPEDTLLTVVDCHI